MFANVYTAQDKKILTQDFETSRQDHKYNVAKYSVYYTEKTPTNESHLELLTW